MFVCFDKKEMIKILATDLDGTLIPLDGVSENRDDLKRLKNLLNKRDIRITFVTGRHIESVQAAIVEHDLPVPDYIIADVGSSIYRRANVGSPKVPQWQTLQEYQTQLDAKLTEQQRGRMKEIVTGMEGVQLQEAAKQSRHKLSFYVEAEKLNEASQAISLAFSQSGLPFSMIASVDPFNGDGLIDVLPEGVSKAYALDWFLGYQNVAPTEAIFAGDSGNDYAALVGGFHAIVVGNASEILRSKVIERFNHIQGGNSVYCAKGHATSGVLEGLVSFLRVDEGAAT